MQTDLRENMQDRVTLALDVLRFVAYARDPRTLRERLRKSLSFARSRHVVLLMRRVQLNASEKQRIEDRLMGRSTGTEDLPSCETCNLTFHPRFKSDDGILSTDTRCAGCIRTETKNKEL